MRGSEEEAAGGRPVAARDAPSGENAGELLHVALAIAAGDAERVQLEQLAGVVLVEPLAEPASGRRIRPDGARVVEVDQHRRMRGDRLQQVGEAAAEMRPDRL